LEAEPLAEGYRPPPKPHLDRVIRIEGSEVSWGVASIGFQREGVSAEWTPLGACEPLFELASATEFEHMATW
jgi:hypothetical protein